MALYGPVGCAALWFAGATPQERRKLVQVNRSINFPMVVGYGLLLAEHEAEHIGLRSTDECLVEAAALDRLPVLLARFFDPPFAALALLYARGYDAAAYRGGC